MLVRGDAVKLLLFIPAEGDPHGILAEGKYGADVPRAVEGSWDGTEPLQWCPADKVPGGNWRGYDRVGCRIALVLAANGETVPEGCDRLARIIKAQPNHGIDGSCLRLWPKYDLADAHEIGALGCVYDLGALVTVEGK